MGDTRKYFPRIEAFTLSTELLRVTLDELRAEGEFRVESLIFWGGAVADGAAKVTHVFVPKGPGVYKHPLQVRVDDAVISALCGALDPPHLVLLGQVHTHLGAAFHSTSDDRFSLDTPGYISIVIPKFARGGISTCDRWAFYECEGGGRFRPIDGTERTRRFFISPDGDVTIHDVRA